MPTNVRTKAASEQNSNKQSTSCSDTASEQPAASDYVAPGERCAKTSTDNPGNWWSTAASALSPWRGSCGLICTHCLGLACGRENGVGGRTCSTSDAALRTLELTGCSSRLQTRASRLEGGRSSPPLEAGLGGTAAAVAVDADESSLMAGPVGEGGGQRCQQSGSWLPRHAAHQAVASHGFPLARPNGTRLAGARIQGGIFFEK